MKVKVLFQGILSEWAGEKEVEVCLAEDAKFAELLSELKRLLGTKMPPQFWKAAKNNLNSSVWARRGKERLLDLQAMLKDGEEITFILSIAGG